MKATMPHSEYLQWVSYFENKKPDIQEQQMAILTTVAANAMGGKAKVTDFLVSKVKKGSKVTTPQDLRGIFGLPSTEI
jgi:hypothetical protein